MTYPRPRHRRPHLNRLPGSGRMLGIFFAGGSDPSPPNRDDAASGGIASFLVAMLLALIAGLLLFGCVQTEATTPSGYRFRTTRLLTDTGASVKFPTTAGIVEVGVDNAARTEVISKALDKLP